ncbi:MAG: 2-oxoglutarate dehydrogenase E1 component [Gammaproteobacteria bacterium]|nr:2-oxoglutarate dehydrogenase E1 component [Gammaproteobacteria bacterium]
MTRSLKDRYVSTPLYGGSAPYVERFYEQYLADPDSVDPGWRKYFDSLRNGAAQETPRGPVEAQLAEQLRSGRRPQVAAAAASSGDLERQAAVLGLIAAFRVHGHRLATLDPLGLASQGRVADLDPSYHGLSENDMESEFYTDGLAGTARIKLRQIIDLLHHIYSRSIGAEFSHLSGTRERTWLQQRFETGAIADALTDEERRLLMQELTAAEGIERYLHTRYVGQKRFSLEGGESLIPLCNDLIGRGGESGVKEVIIGMAHRGRLNVLVNVFGKSPAELFSEFEGTYDIDSRRGSGDVKYHMGFSADVPTPGGNVHIALAFNPSHLEIVNPVVEGSVRARQDRRGDKERRTIMPILIHGDAAFAGQGVVMETLQMSGTRGFHTGGTVHIICNNQIGFTTSDPRDTRSTPYASDVAKMIEAPVLHVNADDPEAVIFAARVAIDYRNTFAKDVIIDLVCYRRHGHNEADEPAATQPNMYAAIRKHQSVRNIYAERLTEAGLIEQADIDAMAEQYREGLDDGRVEFLETHGMIGNEFTVDWRPYFNDDWTTPAETALSPGRFRELALGILNVPDDVELHSRVKRIMHERGRMATGEIPLDWGFAETMAYAGLLTDGFRVRLTGQDSGRGTFFHRHAVLHNQRDASSYIPLQHLAPDQQEFEVIDSLLSEEAVMGFEYGYSTTEPGCLVIWEGQFGDFANGAQVVIDQFISSGEAKWGRLCGLTLFLPHGYEGQGPEHSSARLERFLQLCAEHNMQVCVPSTPAQMFHMIRRQMIRPIRRPLIVMTPKSLLRHRLSVSTIGDLTTSTFQNVIGETDDIATDAVTRVVFCAGKVYFDLLQARREAEHENVAIVRIEQLYPFPAEEYVAQLARYSKLREVVWCQEEPQNQGAWYQIRHHLVEPLGDIELSYAGREGAAAPAAGYYKLHEAQQQALVAAALDVRQAAGRVVHQ